MCQNKTHKSLESLEQSLDRVNAWIGNCDQKAGFLLAIIGVLIAIIFSSDFSQSIVDTIVNPYREYIRNPELNEYRLIRFVYFIFIFHPHPQRMKFPRPGGQTLATAVAMPDPELQLPGTCLVQLRSTHSVEWVRARRSSRLA